MRNPQYFVPLAEAARKADIHRATLYRWIEDGLLKRVERPGNTFGFVSFVAVLELKEQGREKRSTARRVKKLRVKYPRAIDTARAPVRVRMSEDESALSLAQRLGDVLARQHDHGKLSRSEARAAAMVLQRSVDWLARL